MKQEKIISLIEPISYDDLYVSDINPRTVFDPDAIAALAENIRQLGLIQNLAGLRDKSGKVGIVAGGRRYRALALLQDDVRFQSVPVKIAPDEATAKVWASSENHHREQPHPADEIREYADMADRGIPVPSIAVAFGVTEKHVYRRLKLAGLSAAVLDALKNGEITLSNAAAFTVCDDETHILEVLEQVRGEGYSDHNIKHMLKPDAVRETDRRAIFVGHDVYKEAGGRITTDLFAEQSYLDDVALLNDLFQTALVAKATELQSDTWKWAETIDSCYLGYHELEERKLDRIYPESGDLTEDEAKRYDELAALSEAEMIDPTGEAELAGLQAILDGTFSDDQKALSGILIYVDRDGQLQQAEGLVKRQDRAAAIEAGFLYQGSSNHSDKPKSPISQKLADDLSRIAQGARQHAILRDPDLLIDLLAYQLSHGLLWQAPLGLSTSDVPNWPTTEAEGYALDERLTSNPPRDMYGKDLSRSFRAFRKKGADHIRGELTRFLANQYRGGSAELTALVDKETTPSIREVWTPTAANFFGRVGGPYLNGLWCDLLGLAEDHPTATTFTKLKKAEKAAKLESLFQGGDMHKALDLTEEQTVRINTWLPEGME